MLNWSFRVTEITILAIYYYKLHREAKESYLISILLKRVLRLQHCC